MNIKICWTILSLTGLLLLLISCGSKQQQTAQQAPPSVPVTTYIIDSGTAVYYDKYPATVNALNEVEIRPQVSGNITGIYFTDGQHVTKGQKLYTIDQQQYRGSFDQSVANLNVAKANLARAQQDADRYEALAKQDAIAGQTLDHALAELQASKMQVQAAQANVTSVSTGLKYSVITSPLSGTIGISQVKLGAAVAPGQSVLNTVSSDNPLAVDFALQEKEIPRFMQLQKDAVKKDSIFTITLPDGVIYPFPGKIGLIDRAVDPQTGTIKVRLIFNNDQKNLKPGMSCSVRVLNQTSDASVLIPNKAVTEQLGEYFVYIVGDSNKVHQTQISTGTPIGSSIVVNSGLKAGQTIAVQGVQNLREGSVIKIDSTQQNGK